MQIESHVSLHKKRIITRQGCDWLKSWYFIVFIRSRGSTLKHTAIIFASAVMAAIVVTAATTAFTNVIALSAAMAVAAAIAAAATIATAVTIALTAAINAAVTTICAAVVVTATTATVADFVVNIIALAKAIMAVVVTLASSVTAAIALTDIVANSTALTQREAKAPVDGRCQCDRRQRNNPPNERQETGSHPSWSCLLHLYLFLVHFYGVVDSIQFRC